MNACVLHAFSIGLKLKPFTTDRQAKANPNARSCDSQCLAESRYCREPCPSCLCWKTSEQPNYQPCVIFQSRSISHFWRMARASGYPKISAASRSRVRKRLRITFLVSLGSPCYRLTSTSDVFSLPFAYVIGVVRCSNC